MMKTKDIFCHPLFSFLALFLFLFFYYLLAFDASLYHHHYQPLFLFDKTFLKGFLSYPGGPAEWMAQFFLQFFYFNGLGAFILSALSLSIFVLIYKSIINIGDFRYPLILSFLPVALLLTVQNRYNFPLVITFKYLAALLCFLMYETMSNRYKVFIILLSFFMYYILGGGIYLFYVTICVLHELFFSKDPWTYLYAVLNVAVYLIFPYIAVRYLFVISLKDAYLYMVPLGSLWWPFNYSLNGYCYLFFLSFPVLQIALFIYLKYIKAGIKERMVKKPSPSWAGIIHTLIQSLFILLAAALVLLCSFDRQEKKKIQIDYFAQQGRWEELLNVALDMESYDGLVNFHVNRALYHTGQLLDHLFDYPQMAGADVLFLENIPRQGAIPTIDLYFDLGHIQAAQVMAYEGQTHFAYNPRILKSIVMTNIINGKYVAAKKFLDLLNKSIMHINWVKRYRAYLNDESLIKSDSAIQLKRSLTPKSDYFIAIGGGSDRDLRALLKENKTNKMAFEYLMAYYLLEFRLEELVDHLGQFKAMGYEKYPRHIEEAILACRLAFPSKTVTLDCPINQQTIERFEQFNTVLSRFENTEQAKETLRKEFSHTYSYYVFYIKPKQPM